MVWRTGGCHAHSFMEISIPRAPLAVAETVKARGLVLFGAFGQVKLS
jgi:hypothetical protein